MSKSRYPNLTAAVNLVYSSADDHMGSMAINIREAGDAAKAELQVLDSTNTNFEDVGEFHRKMGIHHYDDGPPRNLTNSEFKFRYAFLQEELRELIEAHALGDLAGFTDALVDLVYVALGTAHYARIPFDEAWKRVQAANLQKRPWQEGDLLKPRNTTGEVVKPTGWCAPDVEGAILDRENEWFGK